MYKTFVAALSIIWVLDILNLPFMEFLDTTFPVNGLAWLLIWLFLPGTEGDKEEADEVSKETSGN